MAGDITQHNNIGRDIDGPTESTLFLRCPKTREKVGVVITKANNIITFLNEYEIINQRSQLKGKIKN